MKTSMVVILLLVGAAIGFAIGLSVSPTSGSRGSADRAPEKARAEHRQLERELETERSSRRRAETRAAKAEGTVSSLERELSDLKSGIAASAAARAPAGEGSPPPAGARFFPDAWDGVLDEVDWKTVGTNMSRMAPLIDRVLAALRRGEPPPKDAIIEIQKLNQPLLLAALKASRKVPGTGVNGSFSHPAFMANAIAATLEAAGRPLDEGQAKSLQAIGERYLKLDTERLRSYDETTWELQKLIDEVELRDRFFRDAFALLTPEQESTLRSEETRDRVRADIFSAALVYVGRIRLVSYTEPADLAGKVLASTRGQVPLDDADRERAQGLVRDWAAELPSDLLAWRPDPLDRQGLVRVDLATAWAKQTLGLAKSLAENLPFDEARRARTRKLAAVIFGMPAAPGGK